MRKALEIPVVYRWIFTLAFIALIVVLSVTPGNESADDTVFSWLLLNTAKPVQKLMHVCMYAALSLMWMWTLAYVNSTPARAFLALLLTVSLGTALEVFQIQVPGRFGSILDVFLNAAGAIAGLVLALFIF